MTSCNRVFYNMMTLDKESEDGLQSQYSYQQKDSSVMQKFRQMNNVELINSHLLLYCIVKARAMVSSDKEIQILDDERRKDLVSQIKSLNSKIKKLTNKSDQNHKKRDRIQKKISKKQKQICAIDNKKYHATWGSKALTRDYVSQQWKLKHDIECKAQHIITKEELQDARLDGIYVIGAASYCGNRFCRLTSDLKHIEVCFNRKVPKKERFVIDLELKYSSENYKEILSNLYMMQEKNLISITYNILGDSVSISYDEARYAEILKKYNLHRISNRYMSIDLNPNYLGWAIVDWNSSSDYRIVDSGFYSIKDINDEWFSFNHQKDLPSDAPERIKNSNKRLHEVYEITNNLIHKANHYKVGNFAYEKLSLVTVDNGFGQNFNTLCLNLWEHSKMRSNLDKWCSFYKIKKIEVECKYSSIYGNIIFRKEGFVDPVNAALEIGRRSYEFDTQYIIKTKEIKHNIIMPVWDDFKESIAEAQEAFRSHILSRKGCVLTSDEVSGMTDVSDLYSLYCVLKRLNVPYRVPVETFKEKFDGLRISSRRSRVTQYLLRFNPKQMQHLNTD